MLLVFLISVDIKTDANSIARKSPAENSGILCGSDNGVILTQGISFAKRAVLRMISTMFSLEAASMSAGRG